MNEIMDQVTSKLSVMNTDAITQSTSSLIIAIVVGLIVCFFGFKLIKVFTTLTGLVLGAGIGAAMSLGFGFKGMVPLVVILVCAGILGAASFFMYQFGIFLFVLCYGVGISSSLIQPETILLSLICVVIGIVAAVLAAVYIDPLIIIITAIAGAITLGISAVSLIGFSDNMVIRLVVTVVFAIGGMIVQFMLHSRKIGRKEKIYSNKVKAEVSRESDVEKARKILEEEEEEDDNGDDN